MQNSPWGFFSCFVSHLSCQVPVRGPPAPIFLQVTYLCLILLRRRQKNTDFQDGRGDSIGHILSCSYWSPRQPLSRVLIPNSKGECNCLACLFRRLLINIKWQNVGEVLWSTVHIYHSAPACYKKGRGFQDKEETSFIFLWETWKVECFPSYVTMLLGMFFTVSNPFLTSFFPKYQKK